MGLDAENNLAVGTMVDHYQIIRSLGSGGMAEVYLARDTMLGRKVALKIVHPKRSEEDDLTARFLFEAKTTARFNHPHIITIHGVGMFSGGPYLALEYLEGQTLHERMEHERFSVIEGIRIGKAIAEALSTTHQNNILHRDLKPSNIILSRDGRLRVLDFGLSLLLRDNDISCDDYVNSSEQVPLDKLAGTPAYMAPEQWYSNDVGPAADVWALGMILYEMLVGSHPYQDAKNVQSMANLITSSDPVPGPRNLGHIPFDLKALIFCCLEKNESARPSAHEVVLDLQRLLVGDSKESRPDISPFRGLSSFEEEHSTLFFGRDAEVNSIIERLRHESILPIVGVSGAGKSSFVKAGVIPRLREKGPLILLQMRPGRDPFLNLANRLITAWKNPSMSMIGPLGQVGNVSDDKFISQPLPFGDNAAELAKNLFDHPQLLGLRLSQLADLHRSHVVLFVDQLEELCAFHMTNRYLPDSLAKTFGHSSLDKSDFEPGIVSERYMQAIASASDDSQLPVRLILTVREEFISRLMTGNQIREALDRFIILRKPNFNSLVDILNRSVKTVGYKFESYLTPQEMVKEVRGVQACLPLLQFACLTLWQNRDKKRKVLTQYAYDEMGGVAGALVKHADGVLQGFNSGEKHIAKSILLRLVTEDKTRRILGRVDLLHGLGSGAKSVLKRLVESRLVTIMQKHERDEVEYELVHEALIIQWERLNGWIDESRDELRLLRQLEQAAKWWEKRGKRADDLWSRNALDEVKSFFDKDDEGQTVLVLEFFKESEKLIRKTKFRLAAFSCFLCILVTLLVWFGKNYFSSKLCSGADIEVAAVWNKASRTAIRKAFVETGVSYAADTFAKVNRIFDEYVANWVTHNTQACEKTRVHGKQSEEILDLRMSCLRKRLGEFASVVKVFSSADPAIVQKAVLASSSLTEISICADEVALRSPYPPPKTEIDRQKVDAIRNRLADVLAYFTTGQYKVGLDLVRNINSLAMALDYPPVLAVTLFWLGEFLTEVGDYKLALKYFHDAASIAGKSKDLNHLGRVMSSTIFLVGYLLDKPQEGLLIARDAENIVNAVSGSSSLKARLFNNIGVIHSKQKSFEAAQEYFRKSLDNWLSVYGPENLNLASPYNNMGAVLFSQGEYESALKFHRKALFIREKMLGTTHPQVAYSLHNIGDVLSKKGDYLSAIAHLERAIEIRMNAFGTVDHPLIASTMSDLGESFRKLGQVEKAIVHFRKALSIREKLLGPDSLKVAQSSTLLGNALLANDKPKEALLAFQRATKICRKIDCGNKILGSTLFGLARAILITGGDRSKALEAGQLARQEFGKVVNLKSELSSVNKWLAEF